MFDWIALKTAFKRAALSTAIGARRASHAIFFEEMPGLATSARPLHIVTAEAEIGAAARAAAVLESPTILALLTSSCFG